MVEVEGGEGEERTLGDDSFSHFSFSNIDFSVNGDGRTIGQRSRDDMIHRFQGTETPSISSFKRVMKSLQDPLTSLSMEVYAQVPHLPALALIRNALDSFFIVRHLFVTSIIPADPLFSLLELFRGQIEAEFECERKIGSRKRRRNNEDSHNESKSSSSSNPLSFSNNLPEKYLPKPLEEQPESHLSNDIGSAKIVIRGLYVAVIDALSSGVFLGRWDVCPARSTENQLETLGLVSDLLDFLYSLEDEEWMHEMQSILDFRPSSREGRYAKDEFETMLVRWGTSLDGIALTLDESIYLLHFLKFQILLNQYHDALSIHSVCGTTVSDRFDTLHTLYQRSRGIPTQTLAKVLQMDPSHYLNLIRFEVDALTTIFPHKADVVFSLILSPENFSHQLTMSKLFCDIPFHSM